MDPLVYQVLHLSAGFLLTAYTFQAFAAPDPLKKGRVMMMSGIMSLIMVVAGFGLISKLEIGLEPWVWIKVGCWLVLSAIGGFAYRSKSAIPLLKLIAIACIVTAVYMVYARPVIGG